VEKRIGQYEEAPRALENTLDVENASAKETIQAWSKKGDHESASRTIDVGSRGVPRAGGGDR